MTASAITTGRNGSMSESSASNAATSATPDPSATGCSNSESTSAPAIASTSPVAATRSSSSSAAATREARAETSTAPSESLLTDEELGLTPDDFIIEPWDPIEHWNDDEDIAYFLSYAFESDEREHHERCLAHVARAYGKTELVRDTATGPQTLHEALDALHSPSPSEILQLLRAFDLHLLPKSDRLPLPELAVAEDAESTYNADPR